MHGEMVTVGSKAQVFHGHAKHTSGGLTRKDLMKTKSGRIVSRKKHAAGKRAVRHLFALGFKPKKGSFKLFHRDARKTQRRRGGYDPKAAMPAAMIAQAQKMMSAMGAK